MAESKIKANRPMYHEELLGSSTGASPTLTITLNEGERVLILIFGSKCGLIVARGTSSGIDYNPIAVDGFTLSVSGMNMVFTNTQQTAKRIVISHWEI